MAAGGESSSFHVLLVDDSPVERRVFEVILSRSFRVTTVDSAIMALEVLGLGGPLKSSVPPSDRQEVDLVITDYCMPGMTGYDLMRKIKESPSLRNIPVVITCCDNDPFRINSCLEDGAVEFVMKPIKLSNLDRFKLHIIKSKMKGKNAEQSRESEPEKDSEKNKRKAMEEGISSGSNNSHCCTVI